MNERMAVLCAIATWFGWWGGVLYDDGTVSTYRHLLFGGGQNESVASSSMYGSENARLSAIFVCMRMRMRMRKYGISISMSNIIAHSIGYGLIENVIDAKALAS